MVLAGGLTAQSAVVQSAVAIPLSPAERASDAPVEGGDGSVSEEDKALQEAKSTGKPVELVSARAESSDTWANPDGTFSVRRYGSPVRLWRGGSWVPTDPTLVFSEDGGAVPKSSNVAVRFSGGGSGPMLSGVKDGRTLTLSWPTALPKPTLAGNVATYAEILPGVDLQLKAEVEGFSQLIVVKTAEAAKNPQLSALKFKMDTVGLSVSKDSDTGSLTATNPAGQTVFSSPTPLMWDSSTTTGVASLRKRLPRAVGGVGTDPGDVFEPAPGSKDAPMPTAVNGDTLQITPDQKLLNGAQTKYPVYIDPSWAWGQRENWARVYRKYPDSSFWNAKEVARVGYENETDGLSRSFFQMSTSDIKGATVLDATFRIKNVWSWSCNARPVELWHTGPISSSTTWNRQPSKLSKLDTVNAAKGWQGSTDCPAGNLEFNVKGKIRDAAAKRWSNVTFGMYASDEGDTFGWKKFDAKTATLEVKYNHPPNTPNKLGTNPRTSCDKGGYIGNTQVSLYATVDDPDAGNLTAQFQVFAAGSSTPLMDESRDAAKGRTVTFSLPDSKTATGDYQWRVRAKDADGSYSSWSATCKFSVDRSRPSNPPVISSAEFPSGESGWPARTGKARTIGHFTLSPNGANDVVQYGWYTDYDPAVKYIDVSSVTSSPPSFKPPGYGPHFIHAFSVDKARNRSDTATYVYYAARSSERDGPSDVNGDANGDIWSVDSNGTLLTYAGQGNGQFSSATNGGQSFENAQVAFRGDWGGDGYTDLVALEYDTEAKRNRLWVYPNNGLGIATVDYNDGKRQLQVACADKTPGSDDDPAGCATGDDHWRDADQVIAPGDINGDGKPDLLVKEGKLLWAYYGDRASKFLDKVELPVLIGGTDWEKFTVIAPGDLNGDGLADLWLRENSTGDVYRTLGKEGEKKGVLNPATWGTVSRVKIGYGVPAADYPVIGSSGDVTGDGVPDLWARKPDNTMVGWAGKKTGADFTGFVTGVLIDGAMGGSRIPAGTTIKAGQTFTSRSAKLTMQNDGNLVITSNAGKQLWSTGTGKNPGANAVMQADGSLKVYKADGSTVLWESKTSAPGGYALLQDHGNFVIYNVKGQSQWTSGTAVRHDYNGDGRSDLANWYAAADGRDVMNTFLTGSDGAFKAPNAGYTASAGAWDVSGMAFVTGDFNGDGRGDVVALRNYYDGKEKLFTFLGKADGGFAAPFTSWSTSSGWYFDRIHLQAGDFNGDGRDDIGVWYSASDGSDRLWTFTADVRGGFNDPFNSYIAPDGAWDEARLKFATGDFNGDGRDDLAALARLSDGTMKVHTFRTDSGGGFTDPVVSWTGSKADWGSWDRFRLQSGDFNGDGRDDLAYWYDFVDGHVSLSTMTSTSSSTVTFGNPVSSWEAPADKFYTKRMHMVTGDYDGDGRDDVGALYGMGDGSIRMFTWTAKPDGRFNDETAGWSTGRDYWTWARSREINSYTSDLRTLR
ncbi:FG-GAP-like repeat-containing protein [Streptomyces griseocarneus]|uniref:FG-GAP-like repeat-containing protein n=1 Tax=Streptomyces griseocarneus TaxID=51201 RepID=UPI001CCAC729|nr:FG-GAP-like repeat-containing protein [Streptomyces griseocarneus]MBZ6473893.1 FG-GAP-like repeat-containing protein [Streptomyces griseocarneus]